MKTDIKESLKKKSDFRNEMSALLRNYFNKQQPFLLKTIADIIAEMAPTDVFYKNLFADKDFIHSQDNVDAVYRPMRQYIKARGKLFRPLLSTLIIEAYGKTPSDYRPLLATSELIHCSSLILDDIVDNSLLRRGETCSHMIYGIPLAGNGSLSSTLLAFTLANDPAMPLSEEQRLKIQEILYWEHYACSIGTALDLGWSKFRLHNIDSDQYIQHIVYRSCSYTYRVAARIASVAGNADNKDQEAIFNYSTYTGIAFQFIDDILNLKPETDDWGKTIGEDITEGKRSPLVLHTLKHANASEKETLLDILDSRTTDRDKLNCVIEIMHRNGAFTQVRDDAEDYITSACKEAHKLKIDPEMCTLLKDFAFYVLDRKI